MSLFNAIFRSRAAPVLMGHMGEVSATIIAKDMWIEDVTCIIRHEETIDVEENDRIVKRRTREVDLATDDTISWRGMEEALTNAQIRLTFPAKGRHPEFTEVWGVDQIRNRTDTFIRLSLIRKTAREFSRSGLRRGES